MGEDGCQSRTLNATSTVRIRAPLSGLVDRVMFAVDYPYEDSRVAIDFLAATALDERSRPQISHETAERLFRVRRQTDQQTPEPSIPS